MLILLLFWLPFAVPLYWLGGGQNWVSIVTLFLLYVEFILLVRFWGRQVYQQPHLLRGYGLAFSRQSGREWLLGVSIGILSLLLLFVVQGSLDWVSWQGPSQGLLRIVLEGFLMSLGIGFAEELLFRGWLLDELQRDYRPSVALWVSAIIFALVHGLRPQFPALFLLGLALGWAKRSCRDPDPPRREWLSLSMGLHTGLVWSYYIINVGQLIQYTDRVPTWVTGIDSNPLAGAIGLLFMSLLALGMRYRAQVKTARLPT